MKPAPELEHIYRRLTEVLESEHFRLRYGLANPIPGRGMNRSGVRSREQVLTCLYGLEELYRLATERWSRPPPLTDAGGKTEVLVCDLAETSDHDGPLTVADIDGIPYIILPSRSTEPTLQGELDRALAEAMHEAMHVFNYRERPFGGAADWEWYDDALAIYAEMLLLAGNRDHFRYLGDWIDCPEMPLNHHDARYQAGLFLRYLDRVLGAGFANRVWLESRADELPLDALTGMMPPGLPFLSAAGDDLFASGYCLDSYFPCDPRSPAFHPELFARFGTRAVTESFVGADAKAADTLDHLACRYYRFYLGAAAESLRIDLQADDAPPAAPLKAELAGVTKDLRRGCVTPAVRTPHGLLLECRPPAPDSLDHLVLVVTNCGADRNFDGLRYSLTAAVK